jgi:hypothetical protein
LDRRLREWERERDCGVEWVVDEIVGEVKEERLHSGRGTGSGEGERRWVKGGRERE